MTAEKNAIAARGNELLQWRYVRTPAGGRKGN
jgi:hypothetical protein